LVVQPLGPLRARTQQLASKVDRIVALKTVSMILQRADEIIE
jgi:hypothetical protein